MIAQLRAVLAAGAVALDNARLQSQLAQRVDELHRSRSRIVEATVRSRRHLERDLHDGAQQQLLTVAASLARAELLGAGASVASAIGEARRQLAEAIVELRRLARGIHPAILDGGGLPVALPSLADTVEVPVDVDVPADLATRLSAPVETTLWFVAAEAMTNAARHSRAARIQLRLEAAAGRVTVTVADNGRGGARVTPGGGLAGLSDRVSALGGALRISSSATTGTCVEAALPIMIVDDSVIFRRGLRLLLEAAGIEVLRDVGSTDEIAGQFARLRPDVCILDVRMPPTFTDEGVAVAEWIQ